VRVKGRFVTSEEIVRYLRDNGYPEHLVREGREGLVRRWRQFVEQAERGYSLGLEDYRNDLDIRAILRLAGAEDDPEVTALDWRLKALLVATERRVWESAPGDPFWDFGYPRNAGEELIEGLREEGLA
jgi:hypothetical protein